MCGIFGFAGINDKQLLYKMGNILYHRGPDNAGYYIDKNNKVYLGHTRLSIIDLDTGAQPIFNEHKKIIVIFNGEIYNYLELKNLLIEKGHRFYTNSDTEVLVHLYEEYGYGMPNYLNGIFAFVIYNIEKQELYLARDHFGVKPLHYYYKNGILFFASEIKALLLSNLIKREINLKSLHYALNLRFIPDNETLFKNIYRLPPGHFAVFTIKEKSFNIKRYYNRQYIVNYKMNEEEAIEGIRHYTAQAVKRQLISDVPLGAYISGGLDSSTIVAFASKYKSNLKTFSMGFNEPTDEVNDAKKVAQYFGAKFYYIYTDFNPLHYLKEALWYVEEPKVNMLQGYLLSKFASKKVKVALSGLGGDELFAGYTNNQFMYPLSVLHKIFPNNKLFEELYNILYKIDEKIGDLRLNQYRKGLQLLFSYGNKTKFYSILRNVWDYDKDAYKNIYSNNIISTMIKYKTEDVFTQYFVRKKENIVEQSLNAEFNTKMINDFLLNEDRTSMANSLEVRVPFLDRDLVEFAFSIPYHLKIKHNRTKYIYKKAMEGILPDFVIEKKKWGFAINPYYQFQKDLKKTAIEVLNEKRIKKQGIFNYNYIKKILEHPISPRLRWHYYYIWWLVGFQYWYDIFIDNKK